MVNCCLLVNLSVFHTFFKVILWLTCRLTCSYFVGCQMLLCSNSSNLIYVNQALSNCVPTHSHQLSTTSPHSYSFEPTLTDSHLPSPTHTHSSQKQHYIYLLSLTHIIQDQPNLIYSNTYFTNNQLSLFPNLTQFLQL